jgi:hypothetical protein
MTVSMSMKYNYAERRIFIVILIVNMLCVIKLNVIIHNVVL